MSSPLRHGLIGVGGIGKNHLKAIDKLREEGILELTCVADPFVEKLQEIKTLREGQGVRWYTDFQKLITEEKDLDSITIATPIPLHSRMTAAALARGLFVYLEKPPVPLIQQLNDLIRLDHRKKVGVGFQNIASTTLRHFKKKVLEGAVGQLQSIRGVAGWPRLDKYYQRAGWAGKMILQDEAVFDGPATNALAHLLNDIVFMGGKEMDGFGVPVEIEGEFYRARPMESYDLACIRGKFESGVMFNFAVVHACENRFPIKMQVRGSQGSAWIGEFENEMGSDGCIEFPKPPYPEAFYLSYKQYAEFARGNQPRPHVRLEDTLGFTSSTNAGLMSSGGVHAIQPQYIRKFGEGENAGYDIPGMQELLEKTLSDGKMFSELGAPWARKSRIISVHGLSSMRLQDYMIH